MLWLLLLFLMSTIPQEAEIVAYPSAAPRAHLFTQVLQTATLTTFKYDGSHFTQQRFLINSISLELLVIWGLYQI